MAKSCQSINLLMIKFLFEIFSCLCPSYFILHLIHSLINKSNAIQLCLSHYEIHEGKSHPLKCQCLHAYFSGWIYQDELTKSFLCTIFCHKKSLCLCYIQNCYIESIQQHHMLLKMYLCL